MKLLEEQYIKDPTWGSRKLTIHLKNKGYKINRKRIQRLMRKMVRAIYQAHIFIAGPGFEPGTFGL